VIPEENKENTMFRAMKLRHFAALLGGLSALALLACERDRVTPEPAASGTVASPNVNQPGAGVQPPTTGVEAIKDAPSRFYGKTVRLAGSLDEVYGDRAFELEGTGWAFNDNITVLTKTPVRIGGSPLAKGEEVVVTGTVRPFTVTEIEREIGWDVGSEVEIRLKQRPVIVAESIRRVGEYGQWPEPAPGAAAEPIKNTLVIVTMAEPQTLVGRKIELGRERVQAVTGKGLWVGPSPMSQVFVLPKEAVKDIQPGHTVRVVGTLQKAPKDARKAWDLPANMEGVVREDMVFVGDASVTAVSAPASPPAGTPAGTPTK
jgi:hypothetical protein